MGIDKPNAAETHHCQNNTGAQARDKAWRREFGLVRHVSLVNVAICRGPPRIESDVAISSAQASNRHCLPDMLWPKGRISHTC